MEIAQALKRMGITAEGPRLAYIMMYAELEQVACSGPRRGRQHTYALVDRRAPGAVELDHERALAELTRRYFTSHGPATARDFSWWSGLTVADARAGLDAVDAELEHELDEDGTPWFAAPGGDGAPARGARLLPMYDEAIVAYKDLRVVLAEPPPREGLLSRAIVIDGRTVGSWRRILSKREVTVEATLFRALSDVETRALARAVEDFGWFLGLAACLEVTVATA